MLHMEIMLGTCAGGTFQGAVTAEATATAAAGAVGVVNDGQLFFRRAHIAHRLSARNGDQHR